MDWSNTKKLFDELEVYLNKYRYWIGGLLIIFSQVYNPASTVTVAGVLVFAELWMRLLEFMHIIKPNWQKTPNFLSVALALGITLFMITVFSQVLLDPLAFDKMQLYAFGDIAKSVKACNGTPVIYAKCEPLAFVNETACTFGNCPLSYGDNRTCSWLLKQG